MSAGASGFSGSAGRTTESSSAGVSGLSAGAGQFDSELTGYSDTSGPEPGQRPVGDVASGNGLRAALWAASVFEPAPPAVDASGLPAAGDYASGPPVVHERDPGAHLRSDVPNTRRRSVVFEEDDELDVPDFLK